LGGYSQLPALLASGLNIRLGCEVTAVSWPTAGPAVVTTSTCGTFSGVAVVSTLPLGVLQANTVAFTPPLPQAQSVAVLRMGVGLLNKARVWRAVSSAQQPRAAGCRHPRTRC
jgi:hypothetical protein